MLSKNKKISLFVYTNQTANSCTSSAADVEWIIGVNQKVKKTNSILKTNLTNSTNYTKNLELKNVDCHIFLTIFLMICMILFIFQELFNLKTPWSTNLV